MTSLKKLCNSFLITFFYQPELFWITNLSLMLYFSSSQTWLQTSKIFPEYYLRQAQAKLKIPDKNILQQYCQNCNISFFYCVPLVWSNQTQNRLDHPRQGNWEQNLNFLDRLESTKTTLPSMQRQAPVWCIQISAK